MSIYNVNSVKDIDYFNLFKLLKLGFFYKKKNESSNANLFTEVSKNIIQRLYFISLTILSTKT